MATKKTIEMRREAVAQMLAKSVTSITEISNALRLPYDTVVNDIRYLKAQTKPWLYGLAGEGYAFDCKIVIDKLARIEKRIEEIAMAARTKEDGEFLELAALKQLAETSVTRLSVEGEGPTLLTVRKIVKGEFGKEDLEKEMQKFETKA
jgi:hypothetical protein